MPGSRYSEHAPVGDLRRYVTCVWFQHIPADGTAHMQRIVPDGCVDAMWCDGDLTVAGPDTGPRVAPLAPGTTFVGIRLRPGAAPLLLGDIPASALRDSTVDLSQLWGASADRLADRLHAAAGTQASADILQRAMLGRVAGFDADPVVEAVVGAFANSDPVPVTVLAASLGLSERQLRRRVTEAVGYAPKTLESILRFQRAITLGRAEANRQRPPLAGLAATAGYADQSHLAREVRRLAGITPQALLT